MITSLGADKAPPILPSPPDLLQGASQAQNDPPDL